MKTPKTLSPLCSRRSVALWCGLLLLSSAGILSGCGGASNFTGGGFPIGKSAVLGRVVDAQNPALNLPNVRLTLFSTPAEGGTQVLTTTSDANGEYSFLEVPTGEFSAPVQVSVEPTNPDYRTQAITFQVYNGRNASLLISLPRQSVDINLGKSITMTPSTSTLPPGSTVRYMAKILDANGQPLDLTPTLLLSDALGTIATDGSFTGTTTGTATFTALWYNNLRATANVIVDNNAPQRPPAPPVTEVINRTSQGQSHGGEVGGTVKVGGDLYQVGQNRSRHNP